MMYEGNLDWTQHQSKLVEEFKVISSYPSSVRGGVLTQLALERSTFLE